MLAHKKRSAQRKRARTGRTHVVSRLGLRSPRRLYRGARRAGRVRMSFFSTRAPQHMRTSSPLEPWLGGVAMLAGLVSWGVVLGLLGS